MTGNTDVVYDRLIADEKLKSGTKYERLAAIVFKLLTHDVVVHDLRLRGDIDVPHQIDVIVGDDRRRILVEAKDYGRKIDLPVVRNFSMVVQELKPDEAFVVSTVGFSDNAVKWADAKGLKLALLRIPKEEDFGDLVQRIDFKMVFSAPSDPQVQWFVDPSEAGRFAEGKNPIGGRPIEDVQISNSVGELSPFGPLLQPKIDEEYARLKPGQTAAISSRHDFQEPTWLHLTGEDPIRTSGFEWTVEVQGGTRSFSAGIGVGGLTAELVLRTLDGEIHRIFTNKQIATWTFDGHHVVPRS